MTEGCVNPLKLKFIKTFCLRLQPAVGELCGCLACMACYSMALLAGLCLISLYKHPPPRGLIMGS